MNKKAENDETWDVNENSALISRIDVPNQLVLENNETTKVLRSSQSFLQKPSSAWYTVISKDHWYFTRSGSEIVSLYLWMTTDFFWTQLWYWPSLILGSATIIWTFSTFYIVWIENDLNEFFLLVSHFLWIFANFWWMTGELHDFEFHQEQKVTPTHVVETRAIMTMALIWLGIYYFFLRPMRLISANIVRDIESNRQRPRLSMFFRTWRDYETIHIILWLGKDCAWCSQNLLMWYIFMVPTVLVAADFAWTSLWTVKVSAIERVNSCAVLLWVLANMIWAIGDFYYPKSVSDPFPFYHWDQQSFNSLRWTAGWILLLNMLTIFLAHVALLPCWTAVSRKV